MTAQQCDAIYFKFTGKEPDENKAKMGRITCIIHSRGKLYLLMTEKLTHSLHRLKKTKAYGKGSPTLNTVVVRQSISCFFGCYLTTSEN